MYKVIRSKNDNHYVYDSISNNFFQLSPSDISLLEKTEGGTDSLRKFGNEFWDEIYGDVFPLNLQNFPVVTTEDESPEILVLELTQQCNFRCEYCIYSGAYIFERQHNETTMSMEIIDKVISSFFVNSVDPPKYVSFYGGEPLLCFDLIKYIVTTLHNLGFDPIYSMTTNGTLMNEAIIEFIIEHKFNVSVSYDGINHDKYRKTLAGQVTSDKIINMLKIIMDKDYSFFRDNMRISLTLSPPYGLYENAVFINSHPILSLLQVGVSSVNSENNTFMDKFNLKEEEEKLKAEFCLLADEYIDPLFNDKPFHKALFNKHLQRVEMREMSLQDKAYPPGNCDIGNHRLFISATGEKFICERVGNFGILGHINNEIKQIGQYNEVLKEYKRIVEGTCENCILVRLCDYCISAFKNGDKLCDNKKMKDLCKNQHEWYDLIFYIFLSKKELS